MVKLKKNAALSLGGALLMASAGAHAVEVGLANVTAALDGPLFIQYANAEQFSATNSIDGNGSAAGTPAEGNWGIYQISILQSGTALNPPGSDIQGGGNIIFVDQASGGQLTGIFYGVQVDLADPTKATGGFFDLYWTTGAVDVGAELLNGANLAKRTAADQYTGFTDGTLLAKFEFADGVTGNGTGTTVSTGVVPGSADGTAKSYLNVLTGNGGLWEDILNTDYFTLDPNNLPMASRDVRLDSNFTVGGAGAWNGAGDIVGLRSNDPARVFATPVPAPAVLGLLGAGLVGIGAVRRRRLTRG